MLRTHVDATQRLYVMGHSLGGSLALTLWGAGRRRPPPAASPWRARLAGSLPWRAEADGRTACGARAVCGQRQGHRATVARLADEATKESSTVWSASRSASQGQSSGAARGANARDVYSRTTDGALPRQHGARCACRPPTATRLHLVEGLSRRERRRSSRTSKTSSSPASPRGRRPRRRRRRRPAPPPHPHRRRRHSRRHHRCRRRRPHRTRRKSGRVRRAR